MNLFKITLLAAMVAGLACANISANNDSLDYQQGSNQDREKMQISKEDVISRFCSEEVTGVLPFSPEEVDALLAELKTENLQKLDESIMSHVAKAFGWLSLSGINGILTNIFFNNSIFLCGRAIKTAITLEEVCPAWWWTQAIPFETCNLTTLQVTGYGILALIFIKIACDSGLDTIKYLRYAISHMKATINN